MNQRSYDAITLACVFLAVISGLVFDKFPKLSAIAMVFGGASAIVAVIVYFIFHRQSDDNRESSNALDAQTVSQPTSALRKKSSSEDESSLRAEWALSRKSYEPVWNEEHIAANESAINSWVHLYSAKPVLQGSFANRETEFSQFLGPTFWWYAFDPNSTVVAIADDSVVSDLSGKHSDLVTNKFLMQRFIDMHASLKSQAKHGRKRPATAVSSFEMWLPKGVARS